MGLKQTPAIHSSLPVFTGLYFLVSCRELMCSDIHQHGMFVYYCYCTVMSKREGNGLSKKLPLNNFNKAYSVFNTARQTMVVSLHSLDLGTYCPVCVSPDTFTRNEFVTD